MRSTISVSRSVGTSGSSSSRISYAIIVPDHHPSSGLRRLRRRRRSGERREGGAGSGGQCSIAFVRSRWAWLGSVGVAGAAAWRVLSGRKKAAADGPDPRAEELRKRLDESRSIVSEREEFEEAETPVDHVEERR